MCRDHRGAHSRWQAGGYTDAGPVRSHLRALLDAGISVRAVHCLSGVEHQALAHLIVGGPETGTWPQGRIPAGAARAIMEIPVPAPVAVSTVVPATGTMRRLRALMALGHGPQDLAGQVGVTVMCLRGLLEGHCVVIHVDIARRAAAVFDTEQMTCGDNDAARREALDRGWDPPLAWDEHSIDNPAAEPDHSRPLARFDQRYLEFHDMGLSNDQIAARMNITMDSLARQLLRYGMSERYGTRTRELLSS
jgi:hypothetical protein